MASEGRINLKDFKKYIKAHIKNSLSILNKVKKECNKDICKAIDIILNSLLAGNKLMLCGNGGSAADCQHMAAEFISSFSKNINRKGIPAIALTTDTSILTAYSNDFGYDGVFKRQVETLGKPGDVLLGISTSGNSKNIILALEAASNIGIKRISLTGKDGGLVKNVSEVCIKVPSSDTMYIQECHLTIEHIICAMVEEKIVNNKNFLIKGVI